MHLRLVGTKDYNGDGKMEPVTYKDPKIGEYLTKKNDKGKFPYETPPALETWQKWYKGDESAYEKWKQNRTHQKAMSTKKWTR